MSSTARRRVSRYRLSSSVRIVLKRSVKTRLTFRSTLCRDTSRPIRDDWSMKVCKPRMSEDGEINEGEWVTYMLCDCGQTETEREPCNYFVLEYAPACILRFQALFQGLRGKLSSLLLIWSVTKHNKHSCPSVSWGLQDMKLQAGVAVSREQCVCVCVFPI